jgi:hypothetical protein
MVLTVYNATFPLTVERHLISTSDMSLPLSPKTSLKSELYYLHLYSLEFCPCQSGAFTQTLYFVITAVGHSGGSSIRSGTVTAKNDLLHDEVYDAANNYHRTGDYDDNCPCWYGICL